MLPLLLALLLPDADAAACSCSRSVALPSGNLTRAWAFVGGFDYGVNMEGDPQLWRGFYVKDRLGDSMPGMYMPPMLVQNFALGLSLGLPAHFSLSTTLPYMYKDNLMYRNVDDLPLMEGDADLASFNDVDLSLKWGYTSKDMGTFFGVGAGVSFPTGTVSEGSPVRSGRGVFGGTASASVGTKVSPHVDIAAQVSGSMGFGADKTGYVVAPMASLVAGARWSPRENGKLSLAFFGIQRWTGQDELRFEGQSEALVYKNSGSIGTDVGAALAYTFWAEDVRSAGFSLRAQAPVVQIIGDPMYAQNFGGAASITWTAL